MDTPGARPLLHFTPASGWMNDPLALTWHDGRYHLFFQYVPDRTTWAPECRWGHATSTDLLRWTEHEVALAPGDGDDGVWSGSLALSGDGRPTIFYTAVSVPDFGIGRIRTATPVDGEWMRWQKGDVVVEAPSLDLVAFRDPFLMRDGAGWRMLVGTAIAGGDAAAASYSSPDLKSWSYDGLAARRNTRETEPVWTGALWECPQVFRLDERDVLVTSVWQDDELYHVAYGVGEFSDGRFRSDHWGQLTFGAGYYAPSFFRDTEGRACLIFWIRGAADDQAGWTSALSVPHVLSLDGDLLVSHPHPVLGQPTELGDAQVTQNGYFAWTEVAGDEIFVGPTTTLRRTEDGVRITASGAEIDVPAASPEVRVLLDAQTLEVFTDAGVAAVGAPHPFIA